ncbi:MAG: HD domain-containing protein [Veillonella sp.]|nr:HD domain-containing protein [Veillonella sp.]
MNIREQIEEREALLLSPYAAKSRDAIRDIEEKPDPLRTAFQRDRDRIIHSKCFRRLKHKTQVYIAPGDHYRTRMTHTLEVGQIGRTVARALRLNEDLVEAIAMGHDVGFEVREHFGMTPSSMITAMVEDMVRESLDKPAISMSADVEMTMNLFRQFMFKHVYLAPALIPDRKKASHVVKNLFTHFMEHPDDMEGCETGKAFYSTRDVVDYVAGLTDQYAIKLFKQYYIPNITL